MDMHGVLFRSFGRHSKLNPRTTGWRVASRTEIVVFRGHRAQIQRSVLHPQIVADSPMVHRSGAKVRRPKAYRCILRLPNTGSLTRPPLRSRPLQTKRKMVRVQPILLRIKPRNDGRRHLRWTVISKTPLVPIHLRWFSDPALLQTLIPFRTQTLLQLCDPS